MKKTIFIFVLLSCLAALNAETGYNNKAWNTEKGKVQLFNKTQPGEGMLWNLTEVEKKKMLGTDTKVYYHYFGGKLNAVSYTIPKENLKKIKTKFPKARDKISTIIMTEESCLKYIELGFEKTEDFDLAFNTEMWTLALLNELNSLESFGNLLDKNGEGKIFIYNYNDDTNAYIFENLIQNHYCVVYIYHEQDF